MKRRPARKIGDLIALNILLSSGSVATKQRQLAQTEVHLKSQLGLGCEQRRIACPDCGNEGPHDVSGPSGDREFVCTYCGMQHPV